MYSYHIFYFHFKWENPEKEGKSFSEQTKLDDLKLNDYTGWEHCPPITNTKEADELYDEKNYYYPFVHPVLYDTGEKESILKHFERKEPKERDVFYTIATHNDNTYRLRVDSINLNLYSTGVGVLIFYLINESENQKEPADILAINQYGRRMSLPFIQDKQNRKIIADYISIKGLNGDNSKYYEDFNGFTNKDHWQPSCIINNLITDLIENIVVLPVIDDRMFVNCWYGNHTLSKGLKELKDGKKLKDFLLNFQDSFWYKYLFVDSGEPMCQNNKMKKKLIKKHTYYRWQQYGTLYGVSRYSLVLLTNEDDFAKESLHVHLRTIYARMIELVLVQRASILKFSEEVTRVSKLSEKRKRDNMVRQISALYNSYIRFVNQIYFREVSAQEQGIELYELMCKTFELKEQIEDLDNEIGELHQYVLHADDKTQNENARLLNLIAAVFLPATLVAGIFGMNYGEDDIINNFWWQAVIVILSTGVMYLTLKFINQKK